MTNVISKPVVTDYSKASVPTSAIAKKLAAEAETARTAERKAKSGGIKGLATGRSDTFRINPYLLRIKSGWNVREVNSPENLEHIDGLARSIAVNGVQEALTAYLDGADLTLTDGHCRLLATFRAIEVYGAEVMTVPVKTENRGANEADRLMSQIIRNSGKPLAPLEQATLFKRLADLGWSPQQIGERAACSAARVMQLLDLNGAPKAIKDMIVEGKVAATFALQTMKTTGSDKEAVAKLEKAVSVAKESGRQRATAKHVEADSEGFNKVLKAAFKAAYIDNSGDDVVEVTMKLTPAQWAVISGKLKIV